MAVDTAAKRFSMMDFDLPSQPGMGPPDGSVAASDRAALLWLYNGIALAGFVVEVVAGGFRKRRLKLKRAERRKRQHVIAEPPVSYPAPVFLLPDDLGRHVELDYGLPIVDLKLPVPSAKRRKESNSDSEVEIDELLMVLGAIGEI